MWNCYLFGGLCGVEVYVEMCVEVCFEVCVCVERIKGIQQEKQVSHFLLRI